MSLEGTFRESSILDIFQLVAIQKKTGLLAIESSGGTTCIIFQHGRVISVDEFQEAAHSRLEFALVRTGLVPRSRYIAALKIATLYAWSVEETFISLGLLTVEKLQSALRFQLRETFFRILCWSEGNYHFCTREVAYDPRYYEPIAAEVLLIEFVRQYDEWPVIRKRVPSRDAVFARLNDDGALGLPSIQGLGNASRAPDGSEWDPTFRLVAAAETTSPTLPASKYDPRSPEVAEVARAVYQLVDGERSVGDISEASLMVEYETSKALWSLLNAGLIQFSHEKNPVNHRKSANVFSTDRKEVNAVGASESVSDQYDVFVSYRRSSDAQTARLFKLELEKRGMSAFLDIDDLHPGRFEDVILANIRKSFCFLVVLSVGCLDRCRDQDDWIRRELTTAFATKRQIIPIMMPGFSYPDELPEDVAHLRTLNAIEYSHAYFSAMMGKIAYYVSYAKQRES